MSLEDQIFQLVKDIEIEKQLGDKRAEQFWNLIKAGAAEISHDDLTDVTSNQHHAQAHTLASHSTKAHSELTGVTANQHHPQTHNAVSHSDIASSGADIDDAVSKKHAQAHTLASHSSKTHAELTSVTVNQHHARDHEASHRLGGADALNHDNLAGFVAAEHKSLPNTIAQVLSNHTKAVHDALAINAGLVDGFHASQVAASANTCAVRDAAGYLQLGWINTTSGVASSAQPVRIYCSQDAYIRYMTAANFRLWMSLYTKAEINAALDLTNKTIKTTAKARVYRVGVQHDIVHATPTKVLCGGESFDPGNNWDPVTNFRFTAPVTGYYSVTGAITYVSTVANKLYECHLCKNGAAFAKGAIWLPIASTVRVLCSDIVYLTATQYIELYANHYAGVDTVDVYGDVADTYIAIHLLSV